MDLPSTRYFSNEGDMIKIIFVCHGNICRSPMAEYVMKHLVKQSGVSSEYEIHSAATSTEEIGNDIYPPVKRILHAEGIACSGHCAKQMTRADYEYHDLVFVMDSYNLRNLERLIGKDTEAKVFRLLDFTSHPGDIADPWYTRDFNLTYRQVTEACRALLHFTLSQNRTERLF